MRAKLNSIFENMSKPVRAIIYNTLAILCTNIVSILAGKASYEILLATVLGGVSAFLIYLSNYFESKK
mgnify:CR=1 FL=1